MATIPIPVARQWSAPRQLRLTRVSSAWIWLPSLVYALVLALINGDVELTQERQEN